LQLDLPFLVAEPPTPETSAPAPPAGRPLSVEFVRERRARKYIIRVRPDGSLRVTIPRGGSKREAEAFLAAHRPWAEKERLRVAALHAPPEWRAGTVIPLRGVPTPLLVERDTRGELLRVGGERVRLPAGATDLRHAAEAALKHIAQRELVPRLYALAVDHGLTVTRVSIRDQRTRWGSCSRRGAIALNFRLVQMPPAVCEYVLLHELMHLRQQNHSRRYWKLVEDVCPGFREAERWLRVEGRLLF
jgi:predicted metal-dependent hydrolase